jgi:hypothetical protein
MHLSQVFCGEARMFGYSGQYLRADLFSLMKCKHVIRPTGTGQNTM